MLSSSPIISVSNLSKVYGSGFKALNGINLDKYFPDVWLLTERDQGLRVEGEPGDLFILKLNESGGAGYLWDTHGLIEAGFAVLRDERMIPTGAESVGGAAKRELTTQHPEKGSGTVQLDHGRPWAPNEAPLTQFRFPFDLDGKEIGMPRVMRRQLVAA